MYRQTFNWENLIERLWEFPYYLLENITIILYMYGVIEIQSKCKIHHHTWESIVHLIACSLSSVADRIVKYNDPSEECVKNAPCLLKWDMGDPEVLKPNPIYLLPI